MGDGAEYPRIGRSLMELKRVVLKRYPEGTLQKEDMAIISEPVQIGRAHV